MGAFKIALPQPPFDKLQAADFRNHVEEIVRRVVAGSRV